MSVTLSVEQDSRLLNVKYSGPIDLTQLCTDVAELVSLPDYDPTWDGISDFRDAVVLYTAKDMIEFKSFVESLDNASTGKWAVIMPNIESYAVTTPWEVLSKGIHEKLSVFINEKQAREWLRYRA